MLSSKGRAESAPQEEDVSGAVDLDLRIKTLGNPYLLGVTVALPSALLSSLPSLTSRLLCCIIIIIIARRNLILTLEAISK